MKKKRVILQGNDPDQAIEVEIDFDLEYVLYISEENKAPKIIPIAG